MHILQIHQQLHQQQHQLIGCWYRCAARCNQGTETSSSFSSSGHRNVGAQRPESDAVSEGDCEGGGGRLHQDSDRCWLHSSLGQKDSLVPVETRPTPPPLPQARSLSVRESCPQLNTQLWWSSYCMWTVVAGLWSSLKPLLSLFLFCMGLVFVNNCCSLPTGNFFQFWRAILVECKIRDSPMQLVIHFVLCKNTMLLNFVEKIPGYIFWVEIWFWYYIEMVIFCLTLWDAETLGSFQC